MISFLFELLVLLLQLLHLLFHSGDDSLLLLPDLFALVEALLELVKFSDQIFHAHVGASLGVSWTYLFLQFSILFSFSDQFVFWLLWLLLVVCCLLKGSLEFELLLVLGPFDHIVARMLDKSLTRPLSRVLQWINIVMVVESVEASTTHLTYGESFISLWLGYSLHGVTLALQMTHAGLL